jgi:fructokinase
MRFGIDLGGTKTELLALAPGGAEVLRRRIATPKDYDGLLAAVKALVDGAESELGARGSVGMAIPGSESFSDGRIKNANTVYLNGRPLRADLQAVLGREVRLANDANCFALSEASDGAAAGAHCMFGVIAGTGVGGGVVIGGQVLNGAHGVGGEWGHIPLPAMTDAERADSRACYCGKKDCLETWCSGPFLEREYARLTGREMTLTDIAASDDPQAQALIGRLADRLARAMATLVNILDPDVIVIGGGVSNVARLYNELPPLVERYAFNLGGPPKIVRNRHGDSSGVRGAAWLWPE